MFRKVESVKMRTVLFVDDDEAILHSLERALIDEPYNTLFAKSCQEALEILQQKEIHVIVAEMCMSEMTGLELLRAAKKEYPDVIGMILSGYEKDIELQTAIEQGEIFKIVLKPWKIGVIDFESLIRRAIDHYNTLKRSIPADISDGSNKS